VRAYAQRAEELGFTAYREDLDKLAEAMRRWQDAGATHLPVNTMGVGLTTVDDYLAAVAAAATTLSG
jgi:hypothetical protein